jgi:hypothetical protein
MGLSRRDFEDKVRHWNGIAMLSDEGMRTLLAHDSEQRERITSLVKDRDRWIKEYEELQERASKVLAAARDEEGK